MSSTIVTVVGNVVDSPRLVRLPNGTVTNFRMASTERRFDGARQEFVDGATLWIDVACWNDLGGNVVRSISKGDPVIVQGTLFTDSWESENGRRSTTRIRATAVGPNLARGHADFHRPNRSAAAPADPPVDGGSSGSGDPEPGEPVEDHAPEEEYTGGAAALYEAVSDLDPQPVNA
jgi:single-strand DNA-binding protein